MKLHKITDFLIKLIYPSRCAVCDELIEINTYFCKKCANTIALNDMSICPVCQKLFAQCDCNFEFDNAIAPLIYGDNGKVAMINLKTNASGEAADYFAEKMSEAFLLQYEPSDFDFIIYVPRTIKKQKEKRFNQAQLLAKRISRILNIPIVNDLFIRDENSKTQHTLTASERKINADNSFILVKNPPKNCRIILVDDIITTGATINAMSHKLKESGAKTVLAIVAEATKKYN